MTDEELLRRLAEIEGVKHLDIRLSDGTPARIYEDGKGGYGWNPLTDDGQAMALVKKYMCYIDNDEEGVWDVTVPRRYGSYPGATNSDLNRAICLAVVAAKEQA